MKKRYLLLMALCGTLLLGGCGNRDIIDTNKTYDRAIIQLANGAIVDVNVKQWRDYDGEQIQIVAEDGTVYLTSSFRCDLIRNK